MGRIDALTRFVGIAGWPVTHSLSPAMHNAAFAACGLNWAYLAFPIAPDRLEEAIFGLAAAGCAGINVTIPHKQAVVSLCSGSSEAVQAIGAANTLIPDGNGGFFAENTDAEGFLRALDEDAPLDLEGATVLLIGAGGAGRAVAHAIRSRGGHLLVANRTPERARELGEPVEFTTDALNAAADAATIIVNATSLGMGSDVVPAELPCDVLGPRHVVNDLVYRPGGTPWLTAAANRGARTVDGLGMLLHQGAAAFERWTGEVAPISAMREALLSAGTT